MNQNISKNNPCHPMLISGNNKNMRKKTTDKVSVSLTPDTWSRGKKIAEQNGQSFSSLTELSLKKEILKHEKKDKP